MNDERRLAAWFSDREEAPESVPQGVAMVMANVPRVRQQGRWLPLPLRRSKSIATTPSTTGTAEYQPSPIPASNGQSPTVIGRTMTMFSPAKAITAGALVFALGGVLLIAQPFQQQASVPATTADVEPVWVTGNIALASSCTGPDYEQDGAVRHDWHYVCSPQTWTASDPRFSGEVAALWNDDVYQTDNGFNAVNVSANYLRNEEGGWTCTSINLYEGYGLFPTGLTGETATCIGQGGYEGLSAILVMDDSLAETANPFSGLIFSGDFPPLPEPPAPE